MTKDAIKNIKDSFAAQKTEVKELFHNEHGHCFTAPAEGLTAISREAAEALKEEEEAAEPVLYTLTEADLAKYPELVEAGFKADEEVELPTGFYLTKKGNLSKAK